MKPVMFPTLEVAKLPALPRRGGAWIRPELRWGIYARDQFRCVWCGQPVGGLTLPTLDHVFTRTSPFYDNHPRRIFTACHTCNTSRHIRRLSIWLRALRRDQGTLRFVMDRVARRWIPPSRQQGLREIEAARAFGPLAPLRGSR